MSRKKSSASRKVFISHRHQDRHIATQLQTLLKRHGAETFLDQDRMQAGDVLPDRIRDGVSWCDTLLLVWSARAASSRWVAREWELAYELRKRIIPYLLDRTPLPPVLENLIYVEISDRKHGDAELLKATFGKDFLPPATTLFPGRWQARMDAFGVVGGTYDLELRANGQIEGEGGIDPSGMGAGLARELGMERLFTMRIRVHGEWSYDQGTQTLTLELNAAGFGQRTADTVRIQTTGRERGAIQGQDLAGRSWTLRRLVAEESTKSEGVITLVDDEPYITCPYCSARVKKRNLDLHLAKVHPENASG
jgi:hypothetical protein